MQLKVFAASVFVLVAAGCDQAAKALHGDSGRRQPAAQHAEHSGSATVDLQGGYNEWRASPFIHQFYDLTKTAFADGADKIDFATYQEKSYAIFRAFGGSNGGGQAGEEAMLDHLKGIPQQMVGIVKDDPSVLETYDKFWVALAGPP